MQLAKPALDIGLFVSDAKAHLDFWRERIGLPFEGTVKLGGGVLQHRFNARDSVIKLNHSRDHLPSDPHCGFRSVGLAKAGIEQTVSLSDPDGNAIWLFPPGGDRTVDMIVDLHVSNLQAQDRFWRRVMQFEPSGPSAYRCGGTEVRLHGETAVERHSTTWRALGFRYLTVQVLECFHEHRLALARGAVEGEPPRRLGDVAVISFIRDPDGNFIELSQRASLVGSLDS